MANVLLFRLLALLAIAVTGARTRLIDRDCNHDHDCKPDEFCDAKAQLCQSCVDCGIYNRQFGVVICPKTARECGHCLKGYGVAHGEKMEICEKGNRIFTRTLSSTNETDLSEDESDAAATWVYVVCVFAGIFLGFAVGGVGGILAYKLYFQKKHDRKENEKTKDEKCIELHEMLPENGQRKSSSSLERGEIAYGLLTNNTKHFSDIKNPDSRLEQEVIPLQGNAAPVVNNSLYYADEDNGL